MDKQNFKKPVTVSFIVAICVLTFFLMPKSKNITVKDVISPTEILLDNNTTHKVDDAEAFDPYYSDKNKTYAQKMGITEDEAFILGNQSLYWAKNILSKRSAELIKNELIYNRISYKTKFETSPFCIKNGTPTNKKAFDKQLNTVRKGNFVLVDLNNNKVYPVSKENLSKLDKFVVVRKSHIKHLLKKNKNNTSLTIQNGKYKSTFELNNIKIIVSDMTSKLYPDRNCSSDICKEILNNINNSKESIDIAIYGYSSTPEIEKAIINAKNRGVKIRLVYDVDSKGGNIYPDTDKFVNLIPEHRNDISSVEAKVTMHNKFYIFDNKTVITGSANLSHTDMSGYNSNSIIVIKSPDAAKIFKQEFEQLFNGKFHNSKVQYPNKKLDNLQIFFSPQDKTLSNGIIPLIKNAKKYIYIPTFVITDKIFTDELINAHNRGVEIKIIADSLNAKTNHSKHSLLRNAGIELKAENYAGKMHSKTVIIDDEYLVIGSMNFSKSGENKNDENVVIIHDSNTAKFYKNFFLYQWSKIPDKWLKYVPRAEGKDSLGSCSDGIDNNYDGFTDKDDPACK